jgi:hypothetical protein
MIEMERWIVTATAVLATGVSVLAPTPARASAGLTFSLRNALSAGGVNVQMTYGPTGTLRPVVGDWNGDGRDEIGITWASGAGRVWSLASGVSSGGASERYRMNWGSSSANCVAIAGNHDSAGAYSIGQACRDTARQKWRWTFSAGLSNAGAGAVSYWFGPTHCKPFTGDWDGDGRHGVGVYCVTADGALWALANNPNLVAEPNPSAQFYWGGANGACVPVGGDWDGPAAGGRSAKVGLACPTGPANTWNWKLNNWNNAGGVWRDFNYGNRSDQPVTGDWDGDGTPGVGVVAGIARDLPSTGNAFLDRAVQSAQAGHDEYGVPVSVTAAQAALESGWGESSLSANYHNHFGFKCTSADDPGPIAVGCVALTTRECNASGCYNTTAHFRRYNSMADSFRDHNRLLATAPRYATAMQYVHNPRQFIREVHRAGYATDPDYATKVIDIMDQYDLYRYDD